MKRRDFIAKSSSAALAFYLSSCASKGIADSAAEKDAEAVRRDLSKTVEGPVMRAGDPGYQATIAIDNGRVKRAPALVVAPLSTKDIAQTVKYCRAHSLRLTTKSGGHSAAGYCLNSEGVVLDLSRMNTIQPHEGGGRLSVGAGTRWIQVYDHVQKNESDRVAVGGGCAGVGVAGFLLGGGYSFVSRSYGLGCDNVSAMEFVSADGDVHRLHGNLADPRERDLYWALRGAGGGNFGIVSSFDLQLHPRRSAAQKAGHAGGQNAGQNAEMTMGSLTFPFERAPELLRFYNHWITTVPHELAVYGMIRRFPDPARRGEQRLAVRLNPIFNGPESEGVKLIKPLLDLTPTTFEMYSMTLPQWESFMGTGTAIAGRSAYMRSVMMAPKSLNDEAIAILTRYMSEAPNADSFIVWTHAGGKIRDFGESTSCYPHRDTELMFELKSIWPSSTPQDRDAGVEWAVKFFDELEPHAQGAYANYIDPLLPDWQRKYYRGSYERLVQVKSHWDPSGFFDFQQGIGSSFSPTRTQPLDLSPLEKT